MHLPLYLRRVWTNAPVSSVIIVIRHFCDVRKKRIVGKIAASRRGNWVKISICGPEGARAPPSDGFYAAAARDVAEARG